jgi:hypothetical protein
MRATAMLSAVTVVLLLLHACGDPTVPRVGAPALVDDVNGNGVPSVGQIMLLQ